MATKNRWGRAIVAGVVTEVLIILTIALAIILIRRQTGPTAEGMQMAHSAATWIALILGPILVFLATRWVVRPLSSLHMPHALVLVGLAVAGQLSIFTATVKEGHAPLWIVVLAVVLKIAAAVAAAVLAQRNTGGSSQPASSPSELRTP